MRLILTGMFALVSGDLSVPTLTALVTTAFVAAMARGFSGFGSALIFMPLASAMIGPKAAVALLLIIDGVLALSLVPGAWQLGDKREIGTMALGALLGVPLGAWLLVSTDPLIIRWAIVVLAAVMLLLLAGGWRYHRKPRPLQPSASVYWRGSSAEGLEWVARQSLPTGSIALLISGVTDTRFNTICSGHRIE